MTWPPWAGRSLTDAFVFAAPAMFVFLWASGFIGGKLGLPYAEPMTFLAVRMFVVVLILGGIVVLTRPMQPARMDVVHAAITGFFVHGCYLGGVFVAIDHKLPAGFAALVVSLQPILTSMLANCLLGERVTPRQWTGLVLGAAGVYLVVRGHTEGSAPPLAWAAATVALIGMTIGTLYQKRFGGGIELRTGLLVQYIAVTLLFGVLALAFENRHIEWTVPFLIAITWLVLGLSLGAIGLLYFMIQHQAAARVISLFYMTPPLTALMAWLMFDEELPALALVGMAVCVVGVALVNWRTAGHAIPQSEAA
jgi:drug/metabolite transporter (DMT)-like permease